MEELLSVEIVCLSHNILLTANSLYLCTLCSILTQSNSRQATTVLMSTVIFTQDTLRTQFPVLLEITFRGYYCGCRVNKTG